MRDRRSLVSLIFSPGAADVRNRWTVLTQISRPDFVEKGSRRRTEEEREDCGWMMGMREMGEEGGRLQLPNHGERALNPKIDLHLFALHAEECIHFHSSASCFWRCVSGGLNGETEGIL